MSCSATKVNSYHMGKYLLREAFAADRILPEDILWRQKAAFSDAVGHSMVDDLKANTPKACTPTRSTRKSGSSIRFATPFTKEACSTASCSRSITPAGRDGQGLLDAEQGLGGLRR